MQIFVKTRMLPPSVFAPKMITFANSYRSDWQDHYP
jgi:hypothetical protein